MPAWFAAAGRRRARVALPLVLHIVFRACNVRELGTGLLIDGFGGPKRSYAR
jgi:hypothetical protein